MGGTVLPYSIVNGLLIAPRVGGKRTYKRKTRWRIRMAGTPNTTSLHTFCNLMKLTTFHSFCAHFFGGLYNQYFTLLTIRTPFLLLHTLKCVSVIQTLRVEELFCPQQSFPRHHETLKGKQRNELKWSGSK